MKAKYFLFILLFTSYLARAGESGVVKICYEEWSPYAFLDNNGSYRGSVLNKILFKAAQHNIVLSLFEIPHQRCIKGVKQGVYDVGLFVDAQEGLTLLSKVLVQWEIAVVTRRGVFINSYQDFKQSNIEKVVIGRDYDYAPSMMNQLSNANKEILLVSYYAADDIDKFGLFNLVAKKQADAMLVDKTWAEEIIKSLKLDLQINPWLFHSEPQFVGYHSLSPSKLEKVQKLIADL